jgi:hypothetical protein
VLAARHHRQRHRLRRGGGLALGASAVESGAMELLRLLIILMLGVEIFRPDARAAHRAASGHGRHVGGRRASTRSSTIARWWPTRRAYLASPLAPTIAFEGVRFPIPARAARP